MPKGEHEEVEEETAAEAAATLASTTPSARTTASFTAMDELWEQARLESEERQYQELEREKLLLSEEERLKCARRVEEQRQRREADGTEITDQEQKEADDAEDDYYRSEDYKNVVKQWARLEARQDAFTVHITPRTPIKRWDTGPPTADTDALDKNWDTGQPPDDIDRDALDPLTVREGYSTGRKFPAGPGEATENHYLSRLPPAAGGTPRPPLQDWRPASSGTCTCEARTESVRNQDA
jgi:hypothetical protein